MLYIADFKECLNKEIRERHLRSSLVFTQNYKEFENDHCLDLLEIRLCEMFSHYLLSTPNLIN